VSIDSQRLISMSRDLIVRSRDVVRRSRTVMAPAFNMTGGSIIPPCPKCHRIDLVEPEDQSGSSARWFICNRCGTRFTSPPQRGIT
jgi:hypothetical protein